MVLVAAQRILDIVIAHIDHDIKVFSADRFFDDSLSFSGTKTRNISIDQKGISGVSCKGHIPQMLLYAFLSPFHQVIIYLLAKRLAAYQGNKTEGSYRNVL